MICNLRAIRTSKNLSQKALAEKVGLSQPAIQRYEVGARGMSQKIIVKLANALEVEPWQLLPLEMQPNYSAKEILMAKNKLLDTLLTPYRYIALGIRNGLAFILRNCFNCMVVYPKKKGAKNAK